MSVNKLDDLEEDFPWPYDEGMVIFIVLCVLSAFILPACALCCYNAARGRDPKWMTSGVQEPYLRFLRHNKNDRFMCGIPGIILIICGTATLAAWCSQEALIADHEYLGPMLVTRTWSEQPVQNWRFSYEYDCYTRQYQCGTSENRRTCYEEVCKTGYYEATRGWTEVKWGGSWGCPDHPMKSCVSAEILNKCEFKICSVETHNGLTCSSSERTAAETKTLQCVYDEIQKGSNTPAIPSQTFDVSVVPSHDDLLVYAELYGDCDVCSARFTVPAGAAKRNRAAGFICLWVGLSLFGVFIMKNGCLGMMCGWEGQMPYPIWMEPPRKWERFIRPQKFNPDPEPEWSVRMDKDIKSDVL